MLYHTQVEFTLCDLHPPHITTAWHIIPIIATPMPELASFKILTFGHVHGPYVRDRYASILSSSRSPNRKSGAVVVYLSIDAHMNAKDAVRVYKD